MTAAFAIAYDWLHDIWSDDQKTTIKSNMIKFGLNRGVIAYTNSDNKFTGWWTNNTRGNWNCVCNGGLTLGALAIIGEDDTGTAEQLLGLTVDNAVTNCAQAVSADGSWRETANYDFFGTTGHAEMASALLTATGSEFGLLEGNKAGYALNGLYRMYVQGPASLFAYGDHGPPKFSATSNAVFLYGDYYKHPEYVLFQRDQHDAPEPWSMFWYNPTVSGAFWDNMPLDHIFDDPDTAWASMRSSWTDENALYLAIKSGSLHLAQNHNDLDDGDFVLDAMGTRFIGELGSGDYLSTDYFVGDNQNDDRWLYYRKRTEGQNCILVNKQNQLVTAAPTAKGETDKTAQGSSTVFEVPSGSTAYWVTDITSAYNE